MFNINVNKLAFDKKTVRSFDDFGRLHVDVGNISKAAVNLYLGGEILENEALGLIPDKIYHLLRDPEELKKAAESFNNLPVLNEHIGVTADDHRPDSVIGSTGTDAVFEKPYLKNSLVIWTADAIADINDDVQREISCSYFYRADMTPGTYDGVKYDGVMRDIRGNHVAIVATGRAGPDVTIGDSLPDGLKIMNKRTKARLSRLAILAKGALTVALKPQLAADAKPDYNKILKGVTGANWATRKAGIASALRPLLASDASLSDVHTLLDSLDDDANTEAVDEELEPIAKDEPAPDAPDAAEDEPAPDAAEDESPAEKVLAFLKGKLEDGDLAAVEKLLSESVAEDEEPEMKKPEITKAAMDAAINANTRRTVALMRGIASAEKAVAPYVGELSLTFDSADAVYKAALQTLGIDIDGVHPSAFKHILDAQPKPGYVSLAADSLIGYDEPSLTHKITQL
jgi:hypothetical protein